MVAQYNTTLFHLQIVKMHAEQLLKFLFFTQYLLNYTGLLFLSALMLPTLVNVTTILSH